VVNRPVKVPQVVSAVAATAVSGHVVIVQPRRVHRVNVWLVNALVKTVQNAQSARHVLQETYVASRVAAAMKRSKQGLLLQ
jgi:hypothetical protein